MSDLPTVPSARDGETAYQKLVTRLIAIEVMVGKKEVEQLDACFFATGAVIEFLQMDAVAFRQGAARSLNVLMHALNDRIQGAKPALLYGLRPAAGAGAPRNLAAAVKRAQIILALDLLLVGGIPRQEASKWLASELESHAITLHKKPISAAVILRWRNERGGKSQSGSDRAYKILRAKRELRGMPENPEQARANARALILSLRSMGF